MSNVLHGFFILTLTEIYPNQKKVIKFKTALKSDYAYNLESTVSHRVNSIPVASFSGLLQCDFLSTIYFAVDDRNDPVVFNRAIVDQ